MSVRLGILNLLEDLKQQRNLAALYITHDIATARYFAEDTAVLYAGHLVEQGPSEEVYRRPRHPYTQTLIAAIPQLDADAPAPVAVALGEPPSPIARPAGCAFHPRCPHAMAVCRQEPGPPPVATDGVRTWCHLYRDAGCAAQLAGAPHWAIDRHAPGRDIPPETGSPGRDR